MHSRDLSMDAWQPVARASTRLSPLCAHGASVGGAVADQPTQRGQSVRGAAEQNLYMYPLVCGYVAFHDRHCG